MRLSKEPCPHTQEACALWGMGGRSAHGKQAWGPKQWRTAGPAAVGSVLSPEGHLGGR